MQIEFEQGRVFINGKWQGTIRATPENEKRPRFTCINRGGGIVFTTNSTNPKTIRHRIEYNYKKRRFQW